MALFGVTGVHIDARGRVDRVRMQQVDGASNSWMGTPLEVEGSEAANHIAVGDELVPIFVVAGGTTTGPQFKRVVDLHGNETVELSADVPGNRLEDLVQF